VIHGDNARAFVPLVVSVGNVNKNAWFLVVTGSPVTFLTAETMAALGICASSNESVRVVINGACVRACQESIIIIMTITVVDHDGHGHDRDRHCGWSRRQNTHHLLRTPFRPRAEIDLPMNSVVGRDPPVREPLLAVLLERGPAGDGLADQGAGQARDRLQARVGGHQQGLTKTRTRRRSEGPTRSQASTVTDCEVGLGRAWAEGEIVLPEMGCPPEYNLLRLT
jgi:hypothetical protein